MERTKKERKIGDGDGDGEGRAAARFLWFLNLSGVEDRKQSGICIKHQWCSAFPYYRDELLVSEKLSNELSGKACEHP